MRNGTDRKTAREANVIKNNRTKGCLLTLGIAVIALVVVGAVYFAFVVPWMYT